MFAHVKRGQVIKPTLRRQFRLPPFAQNAKDGGTHCVGDASEIKSRGHAPRALLPVPSLIMKEAGTDRSVCAAVLRANRKLARGVSLDLMMQLYQELKHKVLRSYFAS